VVYEPAFHPSVTKDLKGLDKSIRQRILDKIHRRAWEPGLLKERILALAEAAPTPPGC
jgi:mRNA-degrading endonuclease RelE of RelBE toxin-antitoxin system